MAALERVKAGAVFDLLLTDVVLPRGVSGPACAEVARRALPQLAVLYMSGYTQNAMQHNRLLEDGVHLIRSLSAKTISPPSCAMCWTTAPTGPDKSAGIHTSRPLRSLVYQVRPGGYAAGSIRLKRGSIMSNSVKVALIQNCAEREVAPQRRRGRALDPHGGEGQSAVHPAAGNGRDAGAGQRQGRAEDYIRSGGSGAEDLPRVGPGNRHLDPGRLLAVQGAGQITGGEPFVCWSIPTGAITARYDKLHLFDVDVGDGHAYKESATVEPGERAVVAATPWGLCRASRSATICALPISTALWPRLAAGMLTVPAASPMRPARRIGMCWPAPERSRPAALCSRRTRAALMPRAARPGAIR